MSKKYIVLGLFVIVVAGAMIYLGSYDYSGSVNTTPNNQVNNSNGLPPPNTQPVAYVPQDGIVSPVMSVESQADYVIEITTAGFSPPDIKIKPGDSVIWTNRSQTAHWIIDKAGNEYPEKGTCGSKINSCVGLKSGESFRATLTVVGTWGFYDKLNPQFSGSIIVE